MARRRVMAVKPQTFGGTDHLIKQMERAVVNRSITPTFTANDMLDWLIPPDERHILRAARPLAQGSFPSWDVVMPCFSCNDGAYTRRHAPTHTYLQFDMMALGSLPPKDVDGNPVFQPAPHAAEITSILSAIEEIVGRFNVVRTVVRWFNNNGVTPGAARQYFPALGALLPPEHAFHQTDGQRFKDVFFPHEIAAALREAPEVIAKGLLCDPATNGQHTGRSSAVTVSVTRDDFSGEKFMLFTDGT